MRLLDFQVTKFRNVVDSGRIIVDPEVTCLVGKNEAGKSALLEALYLFNPAYGEKMNVNDQYPRWLAVKDRRAGDLADHPPIVVGFELGDDDVAAVNSELGKQTLSPGRLEVSRGYGGKRVWDFKWSEGAAVNALKAAFPESVRALVQGATSLEQITQALEGAKPDEDGGGPTAQEISEARRVIANQELENGVWQRIVDILEPRLPQFFRFTDYSTLPGRIDFREIAGDTEDGPGRSSLQTARALLNLAGTDMSRLAEDDYELRKGELEAVQIDLTNQVFEYWKQNPDLEVQIDVDKETVPTGPGKTAVARFLEVRLRDRRTGYSNNFSQRSSGFQWFFSFLAAFSEFNGKKSPIVLLDEPALTLHGRAQADFLRFINERLAPDAPVLYTTHSPFMIEPGRLKRVRIVEDQGPPAGSVISDGVLTKDPDSLFPLQAALGYDIAQNLFVGPNNLVVEGTSDFIYLTLMSDLCRKSGRMHLDERWRVLPAGGASNIPTFVSLVGPHLDVTVLADSDTKGMQRLSNMIERKLLDGHRLIMASVGTDSDHADIEDLFSEGDYLKLFNRTYGKNVKVNDLPKGDRIVKRLESHIGQKYDHGEVAETFLRHHHEAALTDTSVDRFSTLIEAINQTMAG
ncbi:MAG: AAA family ATPase [Dehalococcoidia bacterium]